MDCSKVEYQHKELVEYMRTGFVYACVVYEEGHPVDFIHLEVNAGYETMTGLKNVVGKKISELFPGIMSSHSEFVERQIRVAETGNPDRFELYLDSLQKWFDISLYCPNKGYFVALIDDITSRKKAEAMRIKSEERFKTLFHSHSAIQALLDPDTGKVLDVNQTAAEWYGWTVDELKQMYTKDINTLSQAEIEKSLQTVDARKHNKFTGRHRRADGSIRDVEIYRNRIEIDGGTVIHAITHDITERKLAEAEFERLSRVLATINSGNDALLHTEDETELLQKICNIIMDGGDYLMAWVGYARDDEAKSIDPVAQAGLTDEYLQAMKISWADNEYGQGPAARAIRTGQPQSSRIKDIEQDPRFAPWMAEAKKHEAASIYSMPLKTGNSTIGVLSICSERPDAFHTSEAEMLGSLAENLAYGISMLRNHITLTQSEERFRKLFERNAAIKLLLDPENGNIIDANLAASDFYGWSVDELRQMNLAQINTAIKPEVIKNNLAINLDKGHARFSFRHLMKDGSQRDVDVLSTKINDGRKDLINAIIIDVTEKKRYEQINAFRLRILQIADTHSIEELLIATLDEAERQTGSSIGFVFFVAEDQNSLQLQTVSTNTFQNMCKAEGKGQHYSLNKAGVWADAVREKKAVIHNDYASLKHRKGMPDGHAEIKRELVIPINRDGKIMAIMGIGNKPCDYGDQDIEWVEIIANHVWDIVAKKIAEEEKNTLSAQLQYASKMEMIGQLAAGIAHEINNPLNFITLNAHTIEEDFNDLHKLVDHYRRIIEAGESIPALVEKTTQLREEECAYAVNELLTSIPESLKRLQQGIERISTITKSMRSYSFKNDSEQLFAFDLNKAIREALVIAKHEYSTLASVTLTLEELPELFCDPANISQVILNLIINSSHAIKSQNRKSPGLIEIKTWATDESVYCSVNDDGPGIPEQIINRVFEPFFTTKGPGKGTGLGLSISYDIIVNKHKGSISATSLPEGGSAFTFILPVRKNQSV